MYVFFETHNSVCNLFAFGSSVNSGTHQFRTKLVDKFKAGLVYENNIPNFGDLTELCQNMEIILPKPFLTISKYIFSA